MNLNNEVNVDNLGLFNEVDEFVSIKEIEPGLKEYEFIDLASDEIECLKSIIETLENDKDVYLCARGDSKRSKDGTKSEHYKFINKQLYDFFIVGQKAKYYYEMPVEAPFHHVKRGKNIIKDIKFLVKKCNEILLKKQKSDGKEVYGSIPSEFISMIDNLDETCQESWKFVILAFLHNKGNDNYFKPYSGFVSLTYGQNKYDIAKHFAINRNRKGIIYIYILRKDLKQYFKTKEMNKYLFNYFGVKWYDDIHNEIIILNGLFPHNIVGFFEIRKKINKRFVLNPWFHSQIKNDLNCKSTNYRNGVPINQERFMESAKYLDYTHYFTRDYVIDINTEEKEPTIKIQSI